MWSPSVYSKSQETRTHCSVESYANSWATKINGSNILSLFARQLVWRDGTSVSSPRAERRVKHSRCMELSCQTGCMTRTSWCYPLPFYLTFDTRILISPDHISRSQCDGLCHVTACLPAGPSSCTNSMQWKRHIRTTYPLVISAPHIEAYILHAKQEVRP
jgi:hypothetical protein